MGKVKGTRLTESQNNPFARLTTVSSQASLRHKGKDCCLLLLTGERGVAGKRFVRFHSDPCYHHHWPVGGDSQRGRKATSLFYSYILFS